MQSDRRGQNAPRYSMTAVALGRTEHLERTRCQANDDGVIRGMLLLLSLGTFAGTSHSGVLVRIVLGAT